MAEIFSGRPVSGFDSFDGLPEPFKNHKKGHFRADIPDFSEFTNVHIYQGDFEDTIPLYKSWVKNKKIAFIHVDCDLYSSTKTVLTMLKANIKPGTIIVFDEYQEHEEYIKNEQKAFLEMKFNYEIFAQTKHRVGLRIIGA